MNIYFILILLLILYFIIEKILGFFILDKNQHLSISSIKSINNIKFPFENKKNTKLRYIPHPHTNWTLNPYFLTKGNEKIHYKEGFRKTCNAESINQKINNDKKKYKIICVGSSSTYCTDIEKNKDTWPQILQDNLKNNDVEVFNFGVAHFTLTQSIIRLINWISLIKPNLVIIYQAKNDLNVLSNNSKKKMIYIMITKILFHNILQV